MIEARAAWPSLAIVALGAGVVFGIPRLCGISTLIDATIYAAFAILALSLAVIWGAGGLLSLGQASFFGLGGYAYAIVAIDSGNPVFGIAMAIAAPTAFAALFGSIMIWGHVSDVYLAVMTLTVTQILQHFVDQTGGAQWHIGAAALGGFNGIPDVPLLDWPIASGDPIAPAQLFAVTMTLLLVLYGLCRVLLASRFGRVLIATRENEVRSDLLGYDVRLYKLAAFMLGGGLAGLAGAVFANAVFVSPQMFGLGVSAQVIICVIVGGRNSLLGAILASFGIHALTGWLGTVAQHDGLHWVDPNLVLGLVFVACVLAAPNGVVPPVAAAAAALLRRCIPCAPRRTALAFWRRRDA